MYFLIYHIVRICYFKVVIATQKRALGTSPKATQKHCQVHDETN